MADSEEFLREEEERALEGGFYRASEAYEVMNKKVKLKKGSGKLKTFGATGLIIIMVVVFSVVLSSGNLIPTAVSERLVEETDVQYADAVQSKMIVFQQLLRDGEVPDDTAQILKEKGVLVGYINEDGEFVEDNKSGVSSVLKIKDEIVTADNFVKKANSDVVLYKAFNEATYSRAAYYFDEGAEEVFREIGTSRDNYSSNSDFNEVISELMGEGSDIEINTVSLAEKTRQNENGDTEVYYDYEENGVAANSGTDAAAFVSEVGSKNTAGSAAAATLNSADALKVADTMSKEQRSSLFYLVFMENVSKMKAGEGSEAKISELMDYLYKVDESEVVDIKTGEIVETTGSPLESPSLYAVLSGSKMKAEVVQNYSSDRILKTVENRLGVSDGGETADTVAKTSGKVKGAVGRYVNSGGMGADNEVLNTVTPTVASSLVNNSYDTIKGINAGEFLVEGAVNVGSALARKSGASPGDAEAVLAYAQLNSEVLAMDAEVDRMNRSPFDITSKNTFLGSILYKLATTGAVKGLANMISSSLNLVVNPEVSAEDGDGYLTVFGDCETYAGIGAVGSAQCARIGTFDPSTLNDPYNDAEFVSFVENNTTLSDSGKRTINKDSVLADYIKYNNEQMTPLGVTAGEGSSILEMVEAWLTASSTEDRMASGAAFVNSASNPDWPNYKYAQRYVSLARATAVMKQYTNDKTAYNNLLYFEGEENPVVAFMNEYHQTASR